MKSVSTAVASAMRRTTKTRSAFTLIELLVVIAIIAILAAILFPVFAQARDKARQTACLSNEKQISTSILMYVQDYDETYPMAFGNYPGLGWLVGYSFDVPADWEKGNLSDPDAIKAYQVTWANSIQPYAKNYQILKCPSTDDSKAGKDGVEYADYSAANTNKAPQAISYTYNGEMQSYPQAQVSAPADVVLVTEGLGKEAPLGVSLSFPLLNCPDAGSACSFLPRKDDDTCDTSASPAGNGSASVSYNFTATPPTKWVHSKGMNMIFADGHVKYRPLGGVLAPGSTDRRVDPWTAYNPDGSSRTAWFDRCHYCLFRPKFSPELDKSNNGRCGY